MLSTLGTVVIFAPALLTLVRRPLFTSSLWDWWILTCFSFNRFHTPAGRFSLCGRSTGSFAEWALSRVLPFSPLPDSLKHPETATKTRSSDKELSGIFLVSM